MTIVDLAGAPYVRMYVEELGGATDSDQEHRAMVEACRADDGVLAVDLLNGHLERAAASLVGFLEGR